MIAWKTLCNVAAQLTIIAAISFIYYEYPLTYVRLTAEDNWGEFATFISFLIAALLFVALFAFTKNRRRNWWFLALGLGTFLIAMEEISWGQRLFGMPTPDLLLNHNRQLEINFHNLFDHALKSIFTFVSLGFVTYGVFLPIIRLVNPLLDRLVQRLNLPLPTLSLTPLFIAPAYYWMFSGLARNNEIVELFMGFSLMAFAVEQFIHQLQLGDRISSGWGLKDVAIPVCLLASFVTAMVFTSFVNTSNGMFEQNLYYMVKLKLPESGHYKQALDIFSYLERNPPTATKDLLINKAQLLRTLGRHEDALEVLKKARDFELKLILTKTEDHTVLSRLAQIYLGLGYKFKSRKYRDEALDMLDQKINNVESEMKDLKARSSRPAWTYLIWGLEEGRNIKSHLTFERGKVYEKLGEYPQAITEYLKAAKYEPRAEIRRRIRVKISKVLSRCEGKTGMRNISWQKIQQISQSPSPNEMATNWCSAFERI